MSGTLFRLIAKLYLGLFGLALVGVTLVYLVADFGDRLNVFLNHPVAHVAELYWYKSLMTLHQLSPAAMLLAFVASQRGEQGIWIGTGVVAPEGC